MKRDTQNKSPGKGQKLPAKWLLKPSGDHVFQAGNQIEPLAKPRIGEARPLRLRCEATITSFLNAAGTNLHAIRIRYRSRRLNKPNPYK